MIYSLSGKIDGRQQGFAIINVHGVGFKVFASPRTLGKLDGDVNVFTHLHVKEDALDIYGFLSKKELNFFEQLISISGVGPKSALSVMEVDELPKLIAAIQEGRPDLLTQASGIGRKTAERIIIELRGKVGETESASIVKTMDSDSDIIETLVSLGYKKDVARAALAKVPGDIAEMEPRLKAALKILSVK